MLKMVDHSFSVILSCYNKNTWGTRKRLEITSKQSHFVLVFPRNFSRVPLVFLLLYRITKTVFYFLNICHSTPLHIIQNL